jgi:hypothetical protein
MAVFTAIGVSVATGLAAVGAAATIYGVSQQQKAISSQRRAAQTQATMQREQASRQRRSAIRQSIAARAQLQAAAQVRGLGETSALAGGLASISSQLGANLGFGTMMSGLGEQYTQLSARAAQQAGMGELGMAVGGLGFQAAQFSMTPTGQQVFSGLRGD